MKTKNIFLFVLLILINGCFSEEHINFLDVPINGSIDKFADELIKIGFTEAPCMEENQRKINGVFLEKNCEIVISGSGKSNTVYKVKVNLPEESRDSLEVSFGKIQNLCSSKYGIGKSRYHQYRNSDRFHFNEPRRTRELHPGDFTRYTTASGSIFVEILTRSISITFTDKLNSEIQKSEMDLDQESGKY